MSLRQRIEDAVMSVVATLPVIGDKIQEEMDEYYNTVSCEDCGSTKPGPWLRDEVFNSISTNGDGSSYLCEPCMETRLGRSIDDNDLMFNGIENGV